MTGVRPLLRIALGHARRHPLQSGLMVLGVALGVAVVVAIDLANSSALAAFRLSTEAVTGRATHRVVGGPDGLPEEVYVRLRTEPRPELDDVRSLTAPVVEGRVLVPALEGRPLTLLGVDPFAEPPFRSFFGEPGALDQRALDALLVRRGTVLLGQELANEAGLQVGEELVLTRGGRRETATLGGILAPDDDLARRALGGLILSDIATAQELLGRIGRIDRIDVLLPTDGGVRDELLASLEAFLPADAEVVPASAQQSTVESMTEAFRLNLTALSLLALLVGMFLIFNTVRFGVVQRRPTLATLRALGVTRREIFATILAETAVLGLIGATLGVLLGIVLGRGAVVLVTRTINDIYFVLEVRGVTLSAGALGRGVLAGLGAALLAAVLPAREATSVPPVTALRRSSLEAGTRANVPRAVLAAIATATVGGLLLALPSDDVALGFVALGLVVFAFALMAPAATVALMAAVRPLTGRLFGVIGRLGPRGITRTLSRTAVAIAALMVAVCVSIGVSVMVGSFRTTVESWLTDTLGADIFISPPSISTRDVDGRLDPALAERLAKEPGVVDVFTAHNLELRAPDLEAGTGTVNVVAIAQDIAGATRPYVAAIGPHEVVWRAMTEGAISVSEPFFRRHDLGVGDALTLRTDHGVRDFPIAAVHYDYGSERGSIFMADPVYRSYWNDDSITSIALRLDDNVDADEFADRLSAQMSAGAIGPAPDTLSVRSNRGLRTEVLRVFDQAFAITTALQVLAIVVAFIGVLSALMALQLERARESATLRATGMTRGQLGRLSLLQTGLMGGVAGLLSWPAGLSLAMILIYVINRRSFGWTIQTHLDPAVFLRALALAVVAALLAGLWPTWRLSRQPISSALREE